MGTTLILPPSPRLDATSTSEQEPETAIELAAVRGHTEATSILAPFLEGTLALKVAQLVGQESEDSTDNFQNVLSTVSPAEVTNVLCRPSCR